MKRRLTSFAVVMLALLILSSTPTLARQSSPGGASGSGPAGGQPSKLAVVSRPISLARQRAALQFWTRKRLVEVQAMEMPSQAQAIVAEESMAVAETAGAPGRAPSGAPIADADAMASASYPEDWAALAKEATAVAADLAAADMAAADMAADELAGSSQVHTSYTVTANEALQRLYPHRWIGRLAFSTPNGTSFCSATVISGNNIVTAAHCIYDSTNNIWFSNWVFTPAFRNNAPAPYGAFAATRCWIPTAWVNLSGNFFVNGWSQHDVAVCKMGTNSIGLTVNQAVGWAGRQWNAPYVGHYHTMGYPFRNYNNNLVSYPGLFLRACVAESFLQTTETRGMGCFWGGGISGGPWLASYAPGTVSGNYISGVNSGIAVGVQNMYGPRFNTNNIVLLCNSVNANC